MKRYDETTEKTMQEFYGTLNEKDRRRYAGVEALKLGHGGINYISQVLGCDRDSVSRGMKEVKNLPNENSGAGRIREVGGGRKKIEETYPEIDQKFLAVLAEHTAGDPMDETVRWTNLTQREIADKLAQEHEVEVSLPVIRQLLKKHNYRQRQAQKKEL